MACMLERAIKAMQIHAHSLTDNPELISSLSTELHHDFQKSSGNCSVCLITPSFYSCKWKVITLNPAIIANEAIKCSISVRHLHGYHVALIH